MEAADPPSIFTRAALAAAAAVNAGVDRIPAAARPCFSRIVDACIAGASLAIPLLYALGSREESFLAARQ